MGLKDRMKRRDVPPPEPEQPVQDTHGKSRLAKRMAQAGGGVKTPVFVPPQVEIKSVGITLRGKLPGLPVDADPADVTLVSGKTGMFGAAVMEALLACSMMIMDPAWAMAQYEVLRDWLSQFTHLFQVVWGHTRPDPEFVAMSWTHNRFSQVRRILNISPYPTFVADRLPNPMQPPFDQAPRDKVTDAGYLGKIFRLIGFDVGGGPYDQHGRQENTESSRVSSLDLMFAAIITEVQEFLAAVVMFSVFSLNDRVATQMAPSPNMRDVLKALSRMDLPLQQYLELGWIMCDAAYKYLSDEFLTLLEEHGGNSLAAFRALYEGPYRRAAFRWDTILAHLPEQVSEAMAKATARVKAEELVDEALRTGEISKDLSGQVEQFRRARIADCETKELAARAAFPQLMADFHRLTAEALARHAAEKIQAEADLAQAETIVLPDICFKQQVFEWAQDRKRAGKAWGDRCGWVTIHIVESDSYATGAASRYIGYKAERDRLVSELTATFQEEDGSLPPGMARIIRNQVRRLRPAVITAQLRKVRKVGETTWMNYTLASSGMNMTEVQATFTLRVWLQVYRPQGFLLPQCLGGPGDITFAHPDGRKVIYAYGPEFGTAPGTIHETSQDKPGEPITREEFKATLIDGIQRVNARLREERGDSPPMSDLDKLTRAVRKAWLLEDRARRKAAAAGRESRARRPLKSKKAEDDASAPAASNQPA